MLTVVAAICAAVGGYIARGNWGMAGWLWLTAVLFYLADNL